MTLRRLERLISEARLSSNTSDVDVITNNLLTLYSNRVQSMIEDRVFLTSSMNNLFMDDFAITIVDGATEYALPHDIYAKSAIKSVCTVNADGDVTSKLPYISESQSGVAWGYSLKESSIVFNKITTDNVSVNYARKIPSLGRRFGAAISAASSGSVTVGATTDDILVDYDDLFSTVDADGLITSYGNKILTYTKATGALTFTPGTGTIVTTNYVIPGRYATSHSQLPLECEKIFLEVLERRIAQRQSQADINIIAQLTAEEIAVVDAVFAKGSEDNEVPPIVEYLEFI
jgi:hypothetical protein